MPQLVQQQGQQAQAHPPGAFGHRQKKDGGEHRPVGPYFRLAQEQQPLHACFCTVNDT